MNKKGFTLIELLAVIVILAIIALITVPVVIKIINNAKKGAAEDSAYGVIESAKLFWASKQNDFGKSYGVVEFECTTSKVCSVKTPAELTGSLDISGTKPTGGLVTIQNGEVTITDLIFGEYKCNTNSESKVTCSVSGSSNNSTPAVTYTAYQAGDIVYFNPIDGGDTNTCTAANSGPSASGNCMIFNVIETNDTTSKSTITLQLDHNITNNVAWISREDYNDDNIWGEYDETRNDKGAITANNALISATSGWNNVQTIQNELGQSVKARMITVEEIAALPGVTVFDIEEITPIDNLPSWLIQNIGFTYDSNDYTVNSLNAYNNGETTGYWTSSPYSLGDSIYEANIVKASWYLGYGDDIYGYQCAHIDAAKSSSGDLVNENWEEVTYTYGVRPVITISKSKLN